MSIVSALCNILIAKTQISVINVNKEMTTICIIYAPTPLPWLQVKTQRLQVETTLTVRSRNFSFSFSFCHLLIHKLFSKMSPAPAKRMFFGSTQERKLFPLHHAPDRLGNQMSRPEAPHVGPGCYDNHEVCLLISTLVWGCSLTHLFAE